MNFTHNYYSFCTKYKLAILRVFPYRIHLIHLKRSCKRRLLFFLLKCTPQLITQQHILSGVRGQTVWQVVGSCCLEMWLARPPELQHWLLWFWIGLFSPLKLSAVTPCQAVCRHSPVETAGWNWQPPVARLGVEVARLTWQGQVEKQFCSFHVGRRGSQAVCESGLA